MPAGSPPRSERYTRLLERRGGAAVYIMDLAEAPPAGVLLPRLTAAERERASRLASPCLASRFAGRRWGLRAAVAAELGIDAGAVALEWDERGRPRLAGGERCLSAASAGEVALAVVAPFPVGVDVMAGAAAGAAEKAVASLPLARDAAAGGGSCEGGQALRLWMAVEATLKAAAMDLGVPGAAGLVRAESWRADGPCVLRVEGRGGREGGREGGRWRAEDLAVPAGFAAMLAVGADM